MEKIICYALVYAAEGLIAWFYLDYIFLRRRVLWKHILEFVLSYALLFSISQFDNAPLNAICFTGFHWILIHRNYLCGKKTAIIHAGLLCVFVMVAEVMVSIIITLMGHGFSEYRYNSTIMIIFGVWSKLLYLVLVAIGAKIFSSHRESKEEKEPTAMFLFCAMPTVSMVVSIGIIYVGFSSDVNSTIAIIMAISMVSLLVMNLLFLGFYNHLQKINDEQLKTHLSIQKAENDTLYYQTLQNQADSQRILIHDIRSHIQVVKSLVDDGQIEKISEYLGQMDNSIRLIPKARMCNEPVLNALLLRFVEDCKKEGVVFSCDIRDNCLGFMDATSITALFGNLLSNALEAAARSRNREIELWVKRSEEQRTVVIRVNNSCDTTPEHDSEGMYITRKDDRRRHGIGLKSIQWIVQKYCGVSTAQYVEEQREFHHIIHIPMQRKD